jgi:hypothetical protein
MRAGQFFVAKDQINVYGDERFDTVNKAETLLVCNIAQKRTIERECPNTGDWKKSWLREPESYSCSLCGVEYETRGGPYDHRDPEWDYIHPAGIRKMTEVSIVAIVSPSQD